MNNRNATQVSPVEILTADGFRSVECVLDPAELARRVGPSNCSHAPSSSALNLADRIINDPTASNWIRAALARSLRRDLVDAINDAELLLSVLSARLEELNDGGAS